jgi:hypothetical protein
VQARGQIACADVALHLNRLPKSVAALDDSDFVFIPTVAKVIDAFGEVEATGSAEPDGGKLEAGEGQRVRLAAGGAAVQKGRSMNRTTNQTSHAPIPAHMKHSLAGDTQRTKGVANQTQALDPRIRPRCVGDAKVAGDLTEISYEFQ